jgi:hypothetical protein
VKGARLKLAALGLFFAAPFALAWLAWSLDWAPGATSNYGELITPPRPIPGAPLGALRGKWVLVTFDAAGCDAYCEQKLYFMRQVRRAQGKDMDRVERLWVLTTSSKPRPELLDAIEGTRIGRMEPAGFPGDPSEHIYLVDPLGNLMMHFPRDPDPSRMLKDLQRLLKTSRLG